MSYEDPDGPELDLIPAAPGWVWIIVNDDEKGHRTWPIVGWHVYREASATAIPVLAPNGEEPPGNFWILGWAEYRPAKRNVD